MIGLLGSHRCGKTTLAKLYAEKAGIKFVETSVSAIFRDLGYDASVTYDFETRLTIQEEVLKRVDAIYAKHAGTDFITDRTPLDMAAYLLADAIGDRVPQDCQVRVAQYVNNCFESTNKRFGLVLLVQPGIPLVHEEGKAAMNVAYIEHLNSLMFGLSVDERLTSHNYYMPRHVLDLDMRLQALTASIERSKGRVNAEFADANRTGRILIH